MLPILQHFNREVEIVSILVPFMNAGKMAEIAEPLASAIAKVMKERQLEWEKPPMQRSSTGWAMHRLGMNKTPRFPPELQDQLKLLWGKYFLCCRLVRRDLFKDAEMPQQPP